MSYTRFALEQALQTGHGYISGSDLEIIKELAKTESLTSDDLELIITNFQGKLKSVSNIPKNKIVMNKCPNWGVRQNSFFVLII